MAGGDTDLKVLLSRDLSNAVLNLFPLSKLRLFGKKFASIYVFAKLHKHTYAYKPLQLPVEM